MYLKLVSLTKCYHVNLNVAKIHLGWSRKNPSVTYLAAMTILNSKWQFWPGVTVLFITSF